MMDHNVQAEHERTFHFFPRLPAELRCKIWGYSLPGPRLVSVRCGSDDLGCASSSSSASLSFAGCTSPARIPANLHASHESRRETLRHYHATFGIGHRPSQVFFSAPFDILFFGPRDGFMASEAQLRTILMLCNPVELAQVHKVAISDAIFCVTAAAAGTTKVAISLLVDVLRLLRARMPGLRELVFVPREENPSYSRDVCLVEPVMVQCRLARIVKEAMVVAFGKPQPWNWSIMTLSASADVPVYNRQVLGWDTLKDEKNAEYGYVHGSGYAGPEWRRQKHWAGKNRELTRLDLFQESVRREFMHMDLGAHAVPMVVE